MKYKFEITTALTEDTKLDRKGAQVFHAYGDSALEALKDGLSLINVAYKQGISIYHVSPSTMVDIHSDDYGKLREEAGRWRVEYHETRGSRGREYVEPTFLGVALRGVTDEKPMRAPRGTSERLKVPLTPEEADSARLKAAAEGKELGAWLREQIVSALR